MANWQICDQPRWIILHLFKKSICCYFNSICVLLHDDNKWGSSVNKLRYRMLTKKNLSGDRLPPTLDASVLYLSRYFFWTLSSFIKNIKYNIEKSFVFPLYIRQAFFLWHKKITKCFPFKLSFIIHLWHWM